MSGKPPSQQDGGVFERRFAAKGSVIIKQDDFGNEAFLIQSGKVRVSMEDAAHVKVELGTLDAGQIFGEMALVVGGLRGATVEALEDCNLIVLTREALAEKLKRSDPTLRAITTMLMKRLQMGNNTLLNRAGSIDELLETVKVIYNNLNASLPPVKRKSLDNLVRPKLEELLDAIKDFRNKM